MEKDGFSLYLVNIIKSYLNSRFIISPNGEKIQTTCGVPQELGEGVHLVAYADDLAVIVTSKIKEGIIAKSNRATGIIMDKLKNMVSNWQPTKQRQFSWRAPGSDTITTSKYVKYLGLYLHRNLRMTTHVNLTMEKAKKMTCLLYRIMPRIGGPNARNRRILLSSSVISATIYGAHIWHKMLKYQHYRNLLTTINRKLAILITSAYRTAPTVAIEAISGMISIDLLVKERIEIINLGKEHKKAVGIKTMTIWPERWEQYNGWSKTFIQNVTKWKESELGETNYYSTQAITGHEKFTEIRKEAEEKCNAIVNKQNISEIITKINACWKAVTEMLEEIMRITTEEERAAIVQSGSAVNSWSILRDSKTLTYKLVNGIPGGNIVNTSQELKTFLKSRNVTEIMASENANEILFGPVLEPPNENSFLSEYPYQLLDTGDFNQVPIIIGICAEESLLFLKDLQTTALAAKNADLYPALLIPSDLLPNSTDEDIVAEEIKNIYLTDNQTFSSNLTAYAEYLSDAGFAVGILKHAQLTSNYMPVHLYRFAYYGRPVAIPFLEGAEKATHSAEMPFLFNISTNPTPDESNLLTNLIWPALDDEQSFLNINNTLEVGTHLKEEIYSKWSSIYETYGRKPFITF
ncbi:hypothetical protein HUJ04_003178 [Dendroctonus ponderosae]|nr:hypothetical protein HUJ04_003178 [Dendroctonus ponderosae]